MARTTLSQNPSDVPDDLHFNIARHKAALGLHGSRPVARCVFGALEWANTPERFEAALESMVATLKPLWDAVPRQRCYFDTLAGEAAWFMMSRHRGLAPLELAATVCLREETELLAGKLATRLPLPPARHGRGGTGV